MNGEYSPSIHFLRHELFFDLAFTLGAIDNRFSVRVDRFSGRPALKQIDFVIYCINLKGERFGPPKTYL